MKFVVFSDLDGTLLQPQTYSFERAKPALELLRRSNIPLILCSSKTRAEMEIYRRRIKNRHPFIPENGGAIFIPTGYFQFPVNGELRNGYFVITLGASYRTIRTAFSAVRKKLFARVKGFGDMSIDEVCRLTGLSPRDADLAKKREFDEPFIFLEEPDRSFFAEIRNRGLSWTRGNMYHILGNSDKGTAITVLKEFYQNEYGRIVTIGLGDSLNDLPMLQQVDLPVLIKKPDGSHEPMVLQRSLMKTEGIGPDGWNEAISKLLNHESKPVHRSV